MSQRRLFTSSNPSRGRSAAMRWAAKHSSGLPHSVLYISPPEVRNETLVDQWERHGPRLALQPTRFDEIVDTLYEGDTHDGPSTYASQAERQWVIEAALSRITDESHPLYCAGEPSVGLVQQTENVLSLLEFAGLDSENAVRKRLDQIGVDHLAEPLAEFTATVEAVHETAFKRTHTFRGERYLHAIQQGEKLAASEFSEVDVVVVGAFQTLSPLERDLIGVFSSVFDTGIVFAQVTPGLEPAGVDDAISRIGSWYDELGFTQQSIHDSEEGSQPPRSRVAASLYRYVDTETNQSEDLGDDVTIQTHATIRHEVAALVRHVRSLIGDGGEPQQICVAPFDTDTYTKPIAQQLRAADVPVHYDVSHEFFSTTTGDLIDAALNLGTEPNRQEPLVRLLSNPLVQVGVDSTDAILEYADLVESTQVTRLQTHLDQQSQTVVDTIVTACQLFVDNTDLSHGRVALLQELDVPVGERGIELNDDVTFSTQTQHREESALRQLASVCDSLTTVTEETTVETLRRALDQATVDITVGRKSNSVRVCSPTEAVSNPYTHVLVPGLTTEHTPSPPRRPAFARALNESHTDFEAADPIRRTRYLFALLLTSGADVLVTAPERNANGDPYVLADVLAELQRVGDVTIEPQKERTATPATHEDVHRSLATGLETGGITPDAITANAGTYDIDVAEANTVARLTSGVSVAAARATLGIGQYDGRVDPTVVEKLRAVDAPFSPSQLETYAQCGFKYYMSYLLGIEDDEEITLELNALDAGNYIHDVFEGFYNEWTSQRDGPLTEATLKDAQRLLYEVAVETLDELDAAETTFHNRWLRSLFDGLAVEENKYGDPAGSDGLFRRFLTAELELTARDAQPAYFEAHVGLTPRDGTGTVISPDPVTVPGTDVDIRGKIDRLDVTSDGRVIGFDYKTGSTPTEADTVDGLKFQLPAYLLLAEHVLDRAAIGGSYYQVNPSQSISYHAGTIGSEEYAAHARYGKYDTEPLRRERTLEFDTQTEFQEFLHCDIPDRIEQIAAAIHDGSFHPTVLDPSQAKCEYCEYRDACDVRHHRRHNIRDQLERDGITAYTPRSEEVNQ